MILLPGRSGCGQHLCDAHAAKSFAHDVPVGAVAVADDVLFQNSAYAKVSCLQDVQSPWRCCVPAQESGSST